MSKSIIIGGVASLLVLISGVYFLTLGSGSEDLLTAQEKLQNNLSLAQSNLNKERDTLVTMLNNLNQSFPLGTEVQDQMKKASDIVQQTNFLFSDPNGSNPEIILENLLSEIAINAERKNINALLAEWQKKIDLSYLDNINLSESEKIKADTESIKTFIENLIQIVDSLNSQNSGLSQFQIDTYISSLPSVQEIDEVIAFIAEAIENSNNPPTSGEGESSQSSSESTNGNYSVTPEEVVAQQTTVYQAQNEVTTLEEELTEIEAQIPQPVPTPVPVETSTTPNTETQNQNNNSGSSTGSGASHINTNQGIIVQPGPPRLIQGTDPF